MFFMKTKKTAAKQETSQVIRQPRYDCMAHVKVNGFEGRAALRNISASGFCMESKTYAAMQPGEQYTMLVTLPEETGITPFEVKVEVRWVKSDVSSFNVGLLVVNPAAERYLAKYIDYLKAQ
jgi:hypothetical protein